MAGSWGRHGCWTLGSGAMLGIPAAPPVLPVSLCADRLRALPRTTLLKGPSQKFCCVPRLQATCRPHLPPMV